MQESLFQRWLDVADFDRQGFDLLRPLFLSSRRPAVISDAASRYSSACTRFSGVKPRGTGTPPQKCEFVLLGTPESQDEFSSVSEGTHLNTRFSARRA